MNLPDMEPPADVEDQDPLVPDGDGAGVAGNLGGAEDPSDVGGGIAEEEAQEEEQGPAPENSEDGRTVQLDAGCEALISDPEVNWRESALQTDQEIVECLSLSLGRPVGYGELALGGYDPAGGSRLTVITKGGEQSPEQQLLEAMGSDEHHWIVFDKDDFAEPTSVALYRAFCEDGDVQDALDIDDPALCLDHNAWCEEKGVSSDECLETFFNERLNDSDLPIRNPMVASNTTIDGRGSQAFMLFSGVKIGSDSGGEPQETAESVIITNLLFQGAGHTEDHELDPDMVRTTGASHDVWIHQNTFDLTGDSAFDVKVGAFNVTVSFNLLQNVKRAALHGSSDSREINGQIATTIHHNAFVTSDELYDTFGNTGRRVPLIRRGRTHMFNNVFYGYRKDILSVRVGARVAFEDNMFLANPAAVGDDDLEYFQENLLDDFREGGLEVTGTHFWFSDPEFQLDLAATADLSRSEGSTPDMLADYSEASQSTIEANRLPAGQELADYVLARAGRGGAATFNVQ